MRIPPAFAILCLGLVGLFTLVVVSANWDRSTAPRANVAVASTAIPPPAAPLMPSDQSAFIKVVLENRGTYNSGANDMAKGAARVKRKHDICSTIQNFTPRNWIGKISILSSNNDGRGVFGIEIGPGIYVHTWNNALSDFQEHTLIDPGSSLYKTAVKMSKGQSVKFSGQLFSSDVDCVRDTSLTMDGSMSRPEFLFRFDEVESLN